MNTKRPKSPALFLLLAVLAQGACRGSSSGSIATSSTPTSNNILHSSGVTMAIEGQQITIGLRRMLPDAGEASIDFATGDATEGDLATAGVDYRPAQGTLTWGPNDDSEQRILITTMADNVVEKSEVFAIHFANVSGATIRFQSVVCTLFDNSREPYLAADVGELSAKNGGSQILSLHAGVDQANQRYIMAGSLGTTPGFLLGGFHVPLNPDTWFTTTLTHANTDALRRFQGILDFRGDASAEIRIPSVSTPSAIGLQVYHAYVVHDSGGTIRLASNPVPLKIVP